MAVTQARSAAGLTGRPVGDRGDRWLAMSGLGPSTGLDPATVGVQVCGAVVDNQFRLVIDRAWNEAINHPHDVLGAGMVRSSGRHGANVTPQLPITVLVIPCQHDTVPTGSQASLASRWVWMSTC